jgi:hypothetical protein
MHDKMLGMGGNQDAQDAETMLVELEQLTARSLGANMNQ